MAQPQHTKPGEDSYRWLALCLCMSAMSLGISASFFCEGMLKLVVYFAVRC
jgi:hypothetical protein